ncbi:MAG: hypothetical protein EP330_01800 [Deltaproteobacteria bacterium]|nr:MAG: hypothetical protein EP330_01800 [Deltaproteobacteria bacterium]
MDEAPSPWPMIGGIFAVAIVGGLFFQWLEGDTWAEDCRSHEVELRASRGEGARLAPDEYHSFWSCPSGCDEGDAYSCNETALIYASGQGYTYSGGVDWPKAVAYAGRACALESRYCVVEAKYRCKSDPVACREACTFGGDFAACSTLLEGMLDGSGWPSASTAADALPLLRVACGLDAPSDLPPLARKAGILSTEQKRQLSQCASLPAVACALDLATCAQTCDDGEAATCKALADLFDAGRVGIREDKVKASAYRAKACTLDASIEPDCAAILLSP